jgi:AraC-like DNA-binding protein
MEKESLNLILLNAGRAVHEGDWNFRNIKSPFFRIYLVDEGEACMTVEGVEQRLTPGHLYLVPPFSLHNDSCDRHFSLYYLHVSENHTETTRIFEQFRFPLEVPASELDYELMKRLLSINPGKDLSIYDPGSYDNSIGYLKSLASTAQTSFPVRTETNGILLQLLSRFLNHAEKLIVSEDSRIMKTLRFIRENIGKKIHISDLSNQCFLSDDHFTRLFKQEMNDTPIDYINRKKIENAQLKLVINDTPVKDIACSLAFENIPYFNRLFKQLVGKTPTQYRESFRVLEKR